MAAKAAPPPFVNSHPSLTLFTDAKAYTNRFAICDKDGQPVWCGPFGDDRNYKGNIATGELACAIRAIWLGKQIKRALEADALNLTLKVDAQWLTWGNGVEMPDDDGKGGKARHLGILARDYKLNLRILHIPGVNNPADFWTVDNAIIDWRRADVQSLLDKPWKRTP